MGCPDASAIPDFDSIDPSEPLGTDTNSIAIPNHMSFVASLTPVFSNDTMYAPLLTTFTSHW